MSQPDMSDILAQAQEMQAKLQAAQEEIMSSIVIGQAGNGLVSVSMQGSGTVTSVNIDPKVIDPEDPDTLQDLLVGAYNDAHGQLAKIAQDKMGPLQGAMGGFGF
ncbi:MAG: YbaB/EbfC family nucleoid-associated protein [Corynebacterium matruchotii]|nr:YbaB/EbfC family nucleoid-associated protein [Corynebacterium matruchotii]KAB1925297.1 YbaB/EbfC family nucleoid-associated protein [Corynebacterium matruchotii]QIP46412.1 YbaB/EbfC family nucleoid-associated protein [Corynebacterium matruchotii]